MLKSALNINIVVGINRDFLNEKGSFREYRFAWDRVIEATKNNHILIGQIDDSREGQIDLISFDLNRRPKIIFNVVLHQLFAQPFDGFNLTS